MDGAPHESRGKMSPIVLILTSAGVATFVTGIISAGSQWLERRSRRKELLLSKAIEMAFNRTELMRNIARVNNQEVELQDNVKVAEVYYQWLAHLFDEGELPPSASPLANAVRKRPALPPTPGQTGVSV